MQTTKPYQEKGILEQANPWLLAAREQLISGKSPLIATFELSDYNFVIKCSLDSIWVIAHWPRGGGCAFRVAHCAGAKLKVKDQKKDEKFISLTLDSAMGTIRLEIEFIDNEQNQPLLHWTTNLTSKYPLLFSCMPRDVYPLGNNDDPLKSEGALYSKQEGPKAGILYLTITKPQTGSILYMQNFTKLNDYFSKTHSAPYNVVQGKWPELGFSLPTDGKTPLPANSKTTISDAFVLFSQKIPNDQFEAAQQYLDMQIPIYFNLERPETAYHDYLEKARQTIQDLSSKKCTVNVNGLKYLRPYVDAPDKPPESMVQFAVLMPLVEYETWQEEPIPFCRKLSKTIGKFYDSKLKTIVRYLPGAEFSNDGREPQEDKTVMDSWYLFHPLLNLARLAKKGYDDARKVFFDSLKYSIDGAHHFNYKWPVFYDMKTLKAKPPDEGAPPVETDVACIYSLVMVQAYELSNDKCYLEEAEKAAKSIDDAGFNLPYQMNVTAFGASAFWRLYKITGNELYKKLVTLCVANIFANSWLWECSYGYAKNYPTFIGIAPLAKMKDNSYLASYEELEVLSAFDDLFLIADEKELSSSIRVLLAEFARYVLDRCWSYYPSELPKEIIAEKPKTGKIDPKLAFPLEDLREGWQKAGQVGQEVYGAGSALITITRHYSHQEGWPFIVYSEYPTKNYVLKGEYNENSLEFHVCGDERLNCQLRILPFKDNKLPRITVSKSNSQEKLKSLPTKEGHFQFTVTGGTDYTINWKKEENSG